MRVTGHWRCLHSLASPASNSRSPRARVRRRHPPALRGQTPEECRPSKRQTKPRHPRDENTNSWSTSHTHTHCRREATQRGRGHTTRERPHNTEEATQHGRGHTTRERQHNPGEATPLTLSYALPLRVGSGLFGWAVASSGGQYRDPRKDPEKLAPIRPHAKRAPTQQFCWVGARFLRATPTGLEPATSAVTGRRANQLRYGANDELTSSSSRSPPKVILRGGSVRTFRSIQPSASILQIECPIRRPITHFAVRRRTSEPPWPRRTGTVILGRPRPCSRVLVPPQLAHGQTA